MDSRDQARWVGAAPTFVSQQYAYGLLTNPGSNTSIASVTVPEDGVYDVFYWLTVDTNSVYNNFVMAWLTSGLAYIWFHYISLLANTSYSGRIDGMRFTTGEVLRVQTSPAYTGNVTAGILIIQRSRS